MNIRFCSILLLVLTGLMHMACQEKKPAQSTADQPTPVASLAKTTYNLGDTILVQLSRSITRPKVTVDGADSPIFQQSEKSLAVGYSDGKTGLHQLVVSGLTSGSASFSDTLNVEMWSDVVPVNVAYTVLKTYPHRETSFTQGLEFYKGVLYESTGLNGQSNVMQIDVQTGSVRKSVPLANQYFGEGITIVNNKIYQLTWTSGICFRYNLDFSLDKTFTYHTQGWGLTHRDTTLILSDGSNKLFFLSPDFQSLGEVNVYDNKGPIMNLNELEYVNGYVFANVWQTNRIVQIDLKTGKVVGNLNMESILPTSIDTKENVLNGIAFQPTENAFYITGKKWPTLFKLRIKPAEKERAKDVIAFR
ncbi:glutaminyl-peptide cyclotransferase [Spirosoma radiotolerans]|uniref:Glutamine cyclotransferase n=1 Tax=Spirosoma radiotolerans TaxID=1379870 RepID=A0A0E3ZUQ1_9BACT|nr:glutaminyl-peptide cyclotransferase [Spirosoma radiotolerans]AKD55673.1 glutamine cyclotransferase [Spirosoma radiotolerans]